MKTRFLVASAALSALSLAACSKPATDTTNTGDTTSTASTAAPAAGANTAAVAGPATPAGMAAAAPQPTTAPEFVQKAAASDMFEITEARLAEKKAGNADVKAFARMMIADHTKSTQNLKAAIAKSGQTLALPTALPANLQSQVDALNQAGQANFDKTYMDQQVQAHTDALSLLQTYGQSGDVPALKTFASDTMKVVQMHLDRAKAIQSKLTS